MQIINHRLHIILVGADAGINRQLMIFFTRKQENSFKGDEILNSIMSGHSSKSGLAFPSLKLATTFQMWYLLSISKKDNLKR